MRGGEQGGRERTTECAEGGGRRPIGDWVWRCNVGRAAALVGVVGVL